MPTVKPNTRIDWNKIPDDKKKQLLVWLEQYKAKHPDYVTFYRNSKNGPIFQVRALLTSQMRDNIRENTNALAIKSI